MNLQRTVQPLATVAVVVALLIVAVSYRPVTAASARTFDAAVTASPTVEADSLMDKPMPTIQAGSAPAGTLIRNSFLTGLLLLFVGALVLIWARSAPPPGRHRA